MRVHHCFPWMKGKLPAGKKYAAVKVESPSEGELMAFGGSSEREIRAVEPSLDKPSPRTRPIQNTDDADRILRLWTPRGKIAK
jgi:hypothetical protein